MKRLVLIMSLFICFFIPVFAQDAAEQVPAEQVPPESTSPEQVPENNYVFRVNQAGDSFIGIQLSVQIPLNVKNLQVGGAGAFMFSRYLTNYFAIGGELDFSYETTIGSNVYYFIPLMLKGTFDIPVGKFEFSVALSAGFVFQAYLNRNYYGFIAKPEVGAFYRFSRTWSVGLTVGADIIPQWYNNTDNNRVGVILSTGACVRFHF
jgi:hypothetical protein